MRQFLLVLFPLLLLGCFGDGGNTDYQASNFEQELQKLNLNEHKELYSEFFADRWEIMNCETVKDTLGQGFKHLCRCEATHVTNPSRKKEIIGDCNQLTVGHQFGNCLTQKTMKELEQLNITRDSVYR